MDAAFRRRRKDFFDTDCYDYYEALCFSSNVSEKT